MSYLPADEEIQRNKQREDIWKTQWLPRCANAGLSQQQINIARNTFNAGFDSGWLAHQVFQINEFIHENQKRQVHQA